MSIRPSAITNRAPRMVGGVWVCMDCETELKPRSYANRVHRPPLRCFPCGQQRYLFTTVLSGSQQAIRAVSVAKRLGLLRPAIDFECVDCSKPAEQYDHRDYGKPLEVEPVCRSCNLRRGHAKPLDQRIVLSLIWAALSQREAPANGS